MTMENEIIKITEHDGKRAVNARELHQFLGSKQDFSTWIKSRIEKYGFVDNQDFVTAPQIYGTANGGYSTRTEYALTLDMAKELSMVENNEQGRLARKYFIECEKAAKEKLSFGLPTTFAEALRLAADQAEKIEAQQKTIQESAKEIVALSNKVTEMQPKVSYYDKILASKATLTVTQVAQDYGMSAKAFNVMLRNFGIQRKVNGQWVLYRQHLQNGYVHSKSIDIIRHDGQHETKNNTEWTQKGRLFLYEELKRHDVLPLIERG